ncbi:glycosyltransferase family 4 protein [Bradyrhizobium diazoefficiens]|jgi:glycosyltransferase involved in cell wall biosynthesis|nr:glycosyltransferase family 1 protein [Bradyrhizobium diazoefficiens]UCF51642.1 MAG: glycosyltransferase family 4 protein [Bradyrhizobium sp.]MBR0963726.1 glycosyltransferase family 4 protein [Bradyrhizobium diazoefficiens]MBR0977878.1 glycosyltransferase family 4 protein [Bradyrhizobium diazoefficiens]MBR1007388.1 glycosyltransferase family 4 protein [Bradyrhizobium diazoefficiens]MBR1012771.1 glycosyltransferase family 4 protein [Bradyrhizobium diazoefficiens]
MQGAGPGFDARRGWAINGRFLAQRITGVQRYAGEIVAALDALLSQDPELAARLPMRLVVPPTTETVPAHAAIGVVRTRFGAGHGWDQLVLPRYAGAGVLSLGNFGPVLVRNHIVCIHDANTFIQPDSYSRAFGQLYRTLLPLVGGRARRVATVSQFSADMLVRHGVCRREKIFIAPNGHEHALRWDARRATLPLLNALHRPFALLLGSRAKHKNIDIVLEQAHELDLAGIDLVVAGAASGIFAAKPSLQSDNIHQAGYVGDDDLAALYERALCLVFPSRTEGFGIPLLEAMARGCPVVSSNAASLVEVGGDAVAYVDPDDGNGWRDAIIGLSENAGMRASMAAQGQKRAQLFSWKRSAQTYLDEIDGLMQG